MQIKAQFNKDNSFTAIIRIIWMIGFILLPITSFPILVEVSGADTVSPPSVVLFLLIFIIWLAPYVLIKRSLPLEIKPFLLFLLVVVISWGLSFFLPILPYRDHTILTEYKGEFFTLITAAVVYVTTTVWIAAKPGRMRFTMQFISLGGILLILWSLVQAYYVIMEDGAYPSVVLQMQSFISSRGGTRLFSDRVTGMAYEPSWLAHQLIMVYIPLWFSASITNYSAFSKRIFRFSLENLLLICGIGVLFLSFSRIGWLSFLLVVAYAAVYINIKILGNLKKWLAERYKGSRRKVFGFISTIVVIFLFIFVYIGLAASLVYFGSLFEPRLAKILATDFSKTRNLLDLSNRLFFAERAVYWFAGLDVFNKFPLFGVGLGNSGFFFPKTMPAFGFGLTEIQNLFYRFTFMPNTKSMWIRLLAETGLVGFSFFITWLFVVFQSSRFAKIFGTPELKVIGWMGQFVLVAYIAEGFSLDSFAIPYVWISLGLVSAAAVLTRNKVKYELDHPLLD